MSYREVMDLPIRAFWLMNANAHRLMAEKDMRALSLAVAQQADPEKKRQDLLAEMGDTIKVVQQPDLDEPRDEEGFALLKAMAQG